MNGERYIGRLTVPVDDLPADMEYIDDAVHRYMRFNGGRKLSCRFDRGRRLWTYEFKSISAAQDSIWETGNHITLIGVGKGCLLGDVFPAIPRGE